MNDLEVPGSIHLYVTLDDLATRRLYEYLEFTGQHIPANLAMLGHVHVFNRYRASRRNSASRQNKRITTQNRRPINLLVPSAVDTAIWKKVRRHESTHCPQTKATLETRTHMLRFISPNGTQVCRKQLGRNRRRQRCIARLNTADIMYACCVTTETAKKLKNSSAKAMNRTK